jgi:hypothetical protein
MGFDTQVLEGEGDAFSQNKNRRSACMLKPSSPQLTEVSKALARENREAPTPLHEGDAF